MALGKRRIYKPSDLGHFGLGLKSASLGQAESLTVISRSLATPACGRRWLTESARNGFKCDVVAQPYAERLLSRSWGGFPLRTGTVVRWDEVTSFPRSQDADTTNHYIEQVIPRLRDYLGLVFHRLIENGTVGIDVDVEDSALNECGPPQSVASIDPFGYTKSGRGDYPKILQIDIDSSSMELACHIWPPRSKLKEFKIPSSKSHKGQGFYFYHNDRLLQIGGWNGVYQPDSRHQLARVAIEIDNFLSGQFQMNPEKTQIGMTEDVVRAVEGANYEGFDLRTYREDAAKRLQESRRPPGTRQRIIPPGRGLAPAVRQAIKAELELVAGAEPINIRWRNLNDDKFFEIDRTSQTIRLNTNYRSTIVGDQGTSLNDAPILKAALFLLLHDLFQGEYLGPKDKDNIDLWNSILAAAAMLENE